MSFNNFSSLINNKADFISLFLADEKLVKCLRNQQENFLDIEVPDPTVLLYDNIYPCKYIPQSPEEAKSFLAMSFQYDPNRASRKYYMTSGVTFYLFCHYDLIKTSYGCLRYDYALSRVDEIMRGLRSDQWLGEMEFAGAQDEILDQKGQYVGISVAYRSVEFS